MGNLLNSIWEPVTSELGFIEAPAKTVVRRFRDWYADIYDSPEVSIEIVETSGQLADILSNLLPLGTFRMRHLFIPTASRWTAYFDNGYQGADVFSGISGLCETLHCHGIRAVNVPNTIKKVGAKKWSGRYGAVMFELYGPKPNPILNYERVICAANDGGKWVFHTSGTPMEFEETERYSARRIKDRFTPDMLNRYLEALGIHAYEEDFYTATSENPAFLVETKGLKIEGIEEYSLERARAKILD